MNDHVQVAQMSNLCLITFTFLESLKVPRKVDCFNERETRSVATHKPITCQPLAHLGHVEISSSNPTADI